MRSSLALACSFVVAAGCAKPDQIKQCYPMASWSAPVFRCGVQAPVAPPPPVVAEKEPEPAPPPAPDPAVELKDEKIELNEKVNFDTGKATLLPASKTLLDDVVKILNDHPELLRIRIEGHTDSQSGTAFNLRLSNNRAKAVRTYLISKGIDGKRLESKGFGESKPIADNKTPDGREQNRRVELHIVKRAKGSP